MKAIHARARSLSIRAFVVPALLLACLTLPLLDQGAFRVDTGRYAAVALDAWRRGDLVTLHIGEQPYFNKPPLAFWVHGLVLWALGPELWAARLPTVLAGVGCVVATVGFARELSTRRTALLAGTVLALTYEFFRRTREISLDMWLTFLVMVAAWMVARAVRRGRAGWIIGAGIPVGLALLIKPLVALLALPALGLGARWAMRQVRAGGSRRPTRRFAPAWVGATLVALAVAAPWHAAMIAMHGKEFTRQYFGAEIGDRAAGENIQASEPGARPAWFYLGQMAETYWPWLLFVLLAIVTMARRRMLSRRGAAERIALAWLAVWLLALSLFPDRADRYAVVLWPMGAVLAALWLRRGAWGWLQPLVRGLPVGALIVAAIGGVALQLAGVRVQKPIDPQWTGLFAAIEALGEPDLHLAGYDTETASLLYLENGRWPTLTRDRWRQPLYEPGAGASIVYHARSGLAPGPGETVLFHDKDVTLSQLDAATWSPIPR